MAQVPEGLHPEGGADDVAVDVAEVEASAETRIVFGHQEVGREDGA
eukprot:SAG11_NODE_32845_length_280_cov_1.000000_1_plen_45_part_01